MKNLYSIIRIFLLNSQPMGESSFYGVKINLAEVQRELRSPEQLKAEFKAKSSERDEYTRKNKPSE